MTSVRKKHVGRVICCGDLMLEHMSGCLGSRGTTSIVDVSSMDLGGGAFNIAWYLSALGHRAALVAPTGPCDRRKVASHCKTGGITFRPLVVPGARLDILLASISGRGHASLYLRSRLTRPNKGVPIRGAGAIVVTGSRHDEMRSYWNDQLASADGLLRVFVPSYSVFDYSTKQVRAFLSNSDVVFLNKQEHLHLRALLGAKAIETLLPKNGVLVVTKGHEGANAYTTHGSLAVAAVSRSTADVVGAGDAFAAAFISGILDDDSLERCGMRAAAIAALVVKSSEPRIRIPRRSLARWSRKAGAETN